MTSTCLLGRAHFSWLITNSPMPSANFFVFYITIQPTPWILALKWYRQNMSLEKIHFVLLMKTKLGKKEFLKLYIVLLRAELNCTIKASWMGRAASGISKGQCTISKIIFPLILSAFIEQNIFFLRHVLPTPFLRKNSRCEPCWSVS